MIVEWPPSNWRWQYNSKADPWEAIKTTKLEFEPVEVKKIKKIKG